MPEFEAEPGRLDGVVAATLGVRRSDAQRAIAAGRVLVEGRTRPKSFRLAGGEHVVVDLLGLEEVPPEGPPVPVRYEDDHLLEVRERFDGAALLEAAPRTGRTHQIRVHLSSIGHPILGDREYGGGGDDAKRLGLTRPFLHAWRLSFVHPMSGEPIEVEEPMPEDLRAALSLLRD